MLPDARGVTTTYSYDALNRLIGVAYPDPNLDIGYSYDVAPAACAADERFAKGRLGQVLHANRSTQDCHDRFGQITLKVQTINGVASTLRYAYSKAGRLTALTYPDGSVADYVRDPLGRISQVGLTRPGQARRVLRTPAGGTAQITLYDEAGQWLGNYSASGDAQQQAIWLDNYPVALINVPAAGVPELAYIQPDHLGTPRVVIDPVRDVAIWEWSNKSEVFGNQIPSADPEGDGVAFELALRFPGQQATDASGLFYNYQREYDPAVGRYSQSDPIGLSGGINSYLYASATAVGRIDPLGLKDYSECETNEELRYARLSTLYPFGVPMVFLNSTYILDYRAKNDGRTGRDRDTFLVDGERLSAESFGNYIAGYGATYLWGPVGWGVTSLAGMVYDVEDVVQGRPYNWDADSRADIDAGAVRAMHEMLGNRPKGCGCGE